MPARRLVPGAGPYAPSASAHTACVPVSAGPASDRDRHYAVGALNAECADLASWPEGGRNGRLNIAALKLSGFVASGTLDDAEVRAALRDAARAAGLSEGEIGPTIESGFRKGLSEPRYAPDPEPAAPGADLSGIIRQPPLQPGLQPASPIIVVEDDEIGRADRPLDPGPFPKTLLQVPGFISEVVDFCLSVALSPQPILALGGAITLQAVLAARKIADVTDNRTNLYVIGSPPEAPGKIARSRSTVKSSSAPA